MPRVVSWNIRQGGGKRIENTIGALLAAAPDVAVVTEVRQGTSARLLRWKLEHGGLGHQRVSGERHALVVASRLPSAEEPVPHWPAEWSSRIVSTRVEGIHLLAVQFPPDAHDAARARECLIAASAGWRAQRVPRLLIGNLNAGANPAGDAGGDSPAAGRRFEDLLGAGWNDVWRMQSPGSIEDKHIGRLSRGHRIDHALALDWPHRRLPTARYDHVVRERRLSHHSMLIVDWPAEEAAASM